MTFMMHTGRQQRSFAGAAPILSDHEPEQRKTYSIKPAPPVEWNPDEYSRQLFNHMFKKWSVDE